MPCVPTQPHLLPTLSELCFEMHAALFQKQLNSLLISHPMKGQSYASQPQSTISVLNVAVGAGRRTLPVLDCRSLKVASHMIGRVASC